MIVCYQNVNNGYNVYEPLGMHVCDCNNYEGTRLPHDLLL